MSDFRRLRVWQNAHGLALSLYRVSDRFPTIERYNLTSQLRRCGLSISFNIAESCGRAKSGDQRRFLEIAQGSGREALAGVMFARDIGFIAKSESDELEGRIDEIQRMLAGLIRIRRREERGGPGPDA